MIAACPLLALLFVLPVQDDSTNQPCAGPGFAQFDFWVGEWTAHWSDADGNDVTGTNAVNKVLGGCVIHESFHAPSIGFEGWSVSVYDPSSDRWRQTWVDNAGGYLDFVGSLDEGTMELRRRAERDGASFLQRMLWYNIGEDAFDWNWERSDDEGRSWRVLWSIHYVRIE